MEAAASEDLTEGWVLKRKSALKNWKRRWLVLRGAELVYYDDADKGSVCGVVRLDKSSTADISKTFVRKSWQLSVSAVDKRMTFELENENDRNKWLLAINAAIAELSEDGPDDTECVGEADVSHGPVEADQILHSGWLAKKGARMKTWRKRWVVLTKHGALHYYEDSRMLKAKGYMEFEESVRLYTTRLSEYRNYRFCVSTISRTLELSASSLEERSMWLSCCSQVASKVSALSDFIGIVETHADFRHLRSWEESILRVADRTNEPNGIKSHFASYKKWLETFEHAKFKRMEAASAAKQARIEKDMSTPAVSSGQEETTGLKKSSMDRIKERIIQSLISDITQSSSKKICKLVAEGMHEVVSMCAQTLGSSGLDHANPGVASTGPLNSELISNIEADASVKCELIGVLNALGALFLTYRFDEPSQFSRVKFSRHLVINRLESHLCAAMTALETMETRDLSDHDSSGVMIQGFHDDTASVATCPDSGPNNLVAAAATCPSHCANMKLQLILRDLFSNAFKNNASVAVDVSNTFMVSSPSVAGFSGLAGELISVMQSAIQNFMSSKLKEIEAMLVDYLTELVEPLAAGPSCAVGGRMEGALTARALEGAGKAQSSMAAAIDSDLPMHVRIENKADSSWEELEASVANCVGGGLHALWGFAKKKTSANDNSPEEEYIDIDLDTDEDL